MSNSLPSDSSSETQSRILPPPLKWAGGKRWLIPKLQGLLSGKSFNRLVEPFVGGMAVSLALNPQHALLNDTNPHLINFFSHLQKGLVIDRDMRNESDFFYEQRNRFNTLITEGKSISRDAAEIFYYLNRTCFNGLCRFNNKGIFNVPFGSYKTINYLRDFSAYAALLSKWRFSCGDFSLLEIQEGDLLYVDPPYDVEFTKYSKEDFTWADQERLVSWLSSLPCPIIASNQATDRIVSLYSRAGFTIELLPAPRRISCTGDRAPALEMLATKG